MRGSDEPRFASSRASSKNPASLAAANHLPSFPDLLATKSRKMVSFGMPGYFFAKALNVPRLVVAYVASTAYANDCEMTLQCVTRTGACRLLRLYEARSSVVHSYTSISCTPALAW